MASPKCTMPQVDTTLICSVRIIRRNCEIFQSGTVFKSTVSYPLNNPFKLDGSDTRTIFKGFIANPHYPIFFIVHGEFLGNHDVSLILNSVFLWDHVNCMVIKTVRTASSITYTTEFECLCKKAAAHHQST